jgi:hypothetical protein
VSGTRSSRYAVVTYAAVCSSNLLITCEATRADRIGVSREWYEKQPLYTR